MAVIAVYSVKGGVGKTTLAVDLAWRSAVLNQRSTLLWDLDPQGGAGFLLGQDDRRVQRAASLFQRDGRPRELVAASGHERLSLLRADSSLCALPLLLARLGNRRRLAALTALLSGDFERIVLDCPPVQNEVSDQIIGAADVVVVPLPPSPLSFRALDMVVDELKRNHPRHPPILPVLSMYDGRRTIHRKLREEEAANWPVIPVASHIERSAMLRQPVGITAPACPASRALQHLSHVVEAKLATLRVAKVA